MKSISARAFENDQYWLIDLIDFFKGHKHCEKEWEKEYRQTDKEKNMKKFWRR